MKRHDRIHRYTGRDRATRPSDLNSSLVVLFAAAIWGTSGIFVKLIAAETGISALSLAFWRDLTSFAVLGMGLALLRPAWLRVRRGDLRWLLALGGSLGTFHVLWNLGVFLNGVAVATVQQAAMPAIVTVVAWLVWRESLTWNKVVAIILTFVGTVLVSGLDVLGQTTMPGRLFGRPGHSHDLRRLEPVRQKNPEGYNPFTTLTYAFGFAALVLLPFQFFTPQPWPVTPAAMLWFAALIVVATLVPFSAYTFALGRLPASVASILAMSEIAFVAIYAYLLLGERLTASQILGAVLVVAGVLLLYWHRWRAGNIG